MSKMAADTNQQRPFRFFALPRELRDKIYSYSTHDLDDIHGSDILAGRDFTLHVSVKWAPRVSALKVCRQFSSEYSQEVKRRCKLVATDPNYASPELPNFPRPVLDWATKAECYLLTACSECAGPSHSDLNLCFHQRNIKDHTIWLKELAGQGIRKLELVLAAYSVPEKQVWPNNLSGIEFAKALEGLVAIPEARKLKVSLRSQDWPDEDDFAGYSTTTTADFIRDDLTEYGTWTVEGGWRAGANDGDD